MKQNENVKLYAISVDGAEVSKDLAEKIAADGQVEVKFPILFDPEYKVIDGDGLRDPAYQNTKYFGIPHPAVYVIDKTGKVAWAKIESNYRERPANDEIRVALNALK